MFFPLHFFFFDVRRGSLAAPSFFFPSAFLSHPLFSGIRRFFPSRPPSPLLACYFLGMRQTTSELSLFFFFLCLRWKVGGAPFPLPLQSFFPLLIRTTRHPCLCGSLFTTCTCGAQWPCFRQPSLLCSPPSFWANQIFMFSPLYTPSPR